MMKSLLNHNKFQEDIDFAISGKQLSHQVDEIIFKRKEVSWRALKTLRL